MKKSNEDVNCNQLINPFRVTVMNENQLSGYLIDANYRSKDMLHDSLVHFSPFRFMND